MGRKRAIALAVLIPMAVLIQSWVAISIDSVLIGFIAAAMGSLPILFLMRCFLDPCRSRAS